MKTWMKLLAVAVVLGMAVADEVEDHTCYFVDQPGMTKNHAFHRAKENYQPCIKDALTEQMATVWGEANSLGDFRKFFKDFCPIVPQFMTCMTNVTAHLQQCQNKYTTVTFTVLHDLLEHLLPGLCENDGERLAYLTDFHTSARKDTGILIPLRRCLDKINPLLDIANAEEVDVVSAYYLTYKEASKHRRCLKHVEDEAYRTAFEWFLTETINNLKCPVSEEVTTVVPCGDIDVSKVKVTNICALKPLNEPNLYDTLEAKAIACSAPLFSHDLYEDKKKNYTDKEWLKNEYKNICKGATNVPMCLLKISSFAEACLSPEEDKQFQLFVQSMEDLVERSCVEDGVRMANVMHEVYSQTAEHGHALRDCHKTVKEARNSHDGHAVSSKNMRFYHDMIFFKQCVVDKLHENNDVSKGVESMINAVLKKMNCVNPEEGTVVLCETIHEH